MSPWILGEDDHSLSVLLRLGFPNIGASITVAKSSLVRTLVQFIPLFINKQNLWKGKDDKTFTCYVINISEA